MSGDVDLVGAAALLHRSRSWLGRCWRTLTHPVTGEPFPTPFVGGERCGRPWWRREAIDAWKAGEAAAHPAASSTQRPPPAADNDAAPRPMTDLTASLLQAAGG